MGTTGIILALSNRAEFRARHGLDISLRFSVAGRLSFHATRGLLNRGYAGSGCTSVSRLGFVGMHAMFCGMKQTLQVILVIVKKTCVGVSNVSIRRRDRGGTKALPR